jgi:hypothetical protein
MNCHCILLYNAGEAGVLGEVKSVWS